MNTKNENTTCKGDLDMKNTLIIDKFLIFDHAEIDINKFTVFIGPQASGKSIAAKLVYLFYLLPSAVTTTIKIKEKKRFLCNGMLRTFLAVFPKYIWHNQSFTIKLLTEYGQLCFSHIAGKTLTFKVSEYYDKIFKNVFSHHSKYSKQNNNPWEFELFFDLSDYVNEQPWGFVNSPNEIMFAPAGRSFFATLEQNVFSFLSSSLSIDYFLKKFGVQYSHCKSSTFEYELENNKSIGDACLKLLHGQYYRKNQKDYIREKLVDGQNIDVEIKDCSSGQQELLPLLIVSSNRSYSYLMIEEPETHIFPEAQSDIIQYLVSLQYLGKNQRAFLFTTHSPYVLTTLNNLAYAGYLERGINSKLDSEKIKALDKIYSLKERISAGLLSAYHFSHGNVKNIIDKETGLINAEDLDRISDITNDKFSELIDLKLQYDNNAEGEE